MISTGKPWLRWPEDTAVQRGVWRDYYSGEKLEDYTKPWIRPRGEGVGSKCASIGPPGQLMRLGGMVHALTAILEVARAQMRERNPCSL